MSVHSGTHFETSTSPVATLFLLLLQLQSGNGRLHLNQHSKPSGFETDTGPLATLIHISTVIGANLSEPYTNGTMLRNPLVCIYTYICRVHTSPPSPALQANITGLMTSFNNSMYIRMKHGKADGSVCCFLLLFLYMFDEAKKSSETCLVYGTTI